MAFSFPDLFQDIDVALGLFQGKIGNNSIPMRYTIPTAVFVVFNVCVVIYLRNNI